MAINPSQNELWIGLSNGDIHVVNLDSRKEIRFFKQHQSAVFSLFFSERKQQIYSADASGNLAVWDAGDHSLLVYLPFDCGKIRDVAISPTKDHLALACQDGMIRVLDTDNFNELLYWEAHENGVGSLAFHPVHDHILLSGGKDALLKTWDYPKMKRLNVIPAHNFMIYDLLFMGDNKYLVTGSRDKSVKIWDAETQIPLLKLDTQARGHRHSVNALAKVSETAFISASDDKRLILWKTGESIHALKSEES